MMKTRKRLSIILSSIAVISLCSFMIAGSGNQHRFLKNNPETRANIITTIIKNRLELDDAQYDKAYKINLKYARLNQEYINKLDEFESINEFKASPELKSQLKQRRQELKEILNEDQKLKVKDLRENMIHRLETLLNTLKEDNDIE